MILELVNKLRAVRGVSASAGVSIAELESFEQRTGVQLPEELKAFYQITDGISFDDGASKILPLVEAEHLKKQVRDQVHKGTDMQLLDGSCWLNMQSFYSQQSRPDFGEFFVARIRQMMEQKSIPS